MTSADKVRRFRERMHKAKWKELRFWVPESMVDAVRKKVGDMTADMRKALKDGRKS